MGQIFTEKGLYQKFPDAKDLEEAKMRLYDEQDNLMTLGVLQQINDEIIILKYDYDDILNDSSFNIGQNEIITSPKYDDLLSTMKGMVDYNFYVVLEEDLQKISEFKDVNSIFEYIENMQNYRRKNGYKSVKNKLNKILNLSCQDIDYLKQINDVDIVKKYIVDSFPTDMDYEENRKIYEDGQVLYEIDIEKDKKDINSLIDEAMDKLDSLVGLENIKDEFEEIFSTILFEEKTKDNLKFDNGIKHLVFSGNSGTGKTTVAEIIGPLFFKMGYLKNNKIAYIGAQNLVGKYVGHTAPKTEEVINENSGGLIVLDEAYILASPAQKFGNEAITVMLKEMEKNNTMFIFLGYKKEMKEFIEKNSGIQSRIGKFIEFKDYTEEELLDIFKLTVNNTNKDNNQSNKLKVSPEALEKIKDIIHDSHNIKNFGNGRFIKKLFYNINCTHAKNTRNTLDEDKLYTISENDISDDILEKLFFDRDNNFEDYRHSNMGFDAKVYKKQ